MALFLCIWEPRPERSKNSFKEGQVGVQSLPLTTSWWGFLSYVGSELPIMRGAIKPSQTPIRRGDNGVPSCFTGGW